MTRCTWPAQRLLGSDTHSEDSVLPQTLLTASLFAVIIKKKALPSFSLLRFRAGRNTEAQTPHGFKPCPAEESHSLAVRYCGMLLEDAVAASIKVVATVIKWVDAAPAATPLNQSKRAP